MTDETRNKVKKNGPWKIPQTWITVLGAVLKSFFSSTDWWKAPAAKHPEISYCSYLCHSTLMETPPQKTLDTCFHLHVAPLERVIKAVSKLPVLHGWNITQQAWWETGPVGSWLLGYCVFIIILTGLRGQHCLGRQRASHKANPQK